MASPRGYGYPLLPDPYPLRTRLVSAGYLPCQTGYLPTLQRVPVRIGPCYASVFGPWQRVPGSAYLPMQQVGRLWTQRLEGSQSNRSQPLPPVAKNGLDTVFGHSAAMPSAPINRPASLQQDHQRKHPHGAKHQQPGKGLGGYGVCLPAPPCLWVLLAGP